MADREEPSQAEHLAAILTGKGKTSTNTSSVQRSHRFPIYEFVLIENMAKIADCSVSAMINQILAVGIDAMYDHLPKDLVEKIHTVTEEQIKKSNSQLSQTVGKNYKKSK